MKRLSFVRVVMSAATLAGLASLPPRADAQTPPAAPPATSSPAGGCGRAAWRMPGPAVARGAQGGARRRDAGRDQRPEQPHVGDHREPRRRRVRGRLLRRRIAARSGRAAASSPPRRRTRPTPSASTPPRRATDRARPRASRSSTANLYSAVQPGGSLYGLQHSNPVDTDAAYEAGGSAAFGTTGDPMVNRAIGGVNVFGGGLGLYASGGRLVGGVGVSGDTSCADHYIAWRVRQALNLDFLAGVGGVSGDAHAARTTSCSTSPTTRPAAAASARADSDTRSASTRAIRRRCPWSADAAPRAWAGAVGRDRRVDRADPRRAGDRQRPIRAPRRVPRHVQPADRGRPRPRRDRRDRRGAGAHQDAPGAPLRRAGGGARDRLGLLRRDRQRRPGDPRRRARPLRRVRRHRLAVPAGVARPAGRLGDRRAGARGADCRHRRRGVPVVPAGARRRARRPRAERGRDRLRPARRRGDHAARRIPPAAGRGDSIRLVARLARAHRRRARRVRAPRASGPSDGGRRASATFESRYTAAELDRARPPARRHLAPRSAAACGRRASRARIST